jgi:hypothetical protein
MYSWGSYKTEAPILSSQILSADSANTVVVRLVPARQATFADWPVAKLIIYRENPMKIPDWEKNR